MLYDHYNLRHTINCEAELATLIDINDVRRDINDLRRDMDTRLIQLEQRLIIKLGAIKA